MKPTPITPGRKVSNPVVRWTPSQTPAKRKPRIHPSSTKVTPRSMLNIPVQSNTPTLIRTPTSKPAAQNIAHQQTSVRNQLINKPPISATQAVSRKLKQKSVKLLNVPRSKPSDKILTYTTPPINLFPSNDNTGSDHPNITQLKAPIAPMSKLPPQ